MANREIPIQPAAVADEGVVDLVTALDTMHGVITLDSSPEGPGGLARVRFRTHENAALPGAMDDLIGVVDGQAWREQIRLSLRTGEGDTLVADLCCPPSLVPAVADRVRASAGRPAG
jgi:hypothetical protein